VVSRILKDYHSDQLGCEKQLEQKRQKTSGRVVVTLQWKHHLAKRTAIERFFAFAKGNYRLEYSQVGGMLKVPLHVFIGHERITLGCLWLRAHANWQSRNSTASTESPPQP
jgi:hypothetical protein